MGDIIRLQRIWHTGNGAREALIEQLDVEAEKANGENDLLLVDRLLAGLWLKGFKIVPLDADEVDRSA